MLFRAFFFFFEAIFGLDPLVIKYLKENAQKVSDEALENLFENPNSVVLKWSQD